MSGPIVGRLLLYASLEDPKSLYESGLNFFELLLVIAGIVLAWGCIGEYLEEHGRINAIPRFLRWPKLAFVLMVVISLIGEFVGDGGVYVCSSKLQILEGATIQALDKEATAAAHKAEGAVVTSDTAVAKASGASEVSQKAYATSDEAIRVARGARQEADTFEKDIVTAKKQAADAESYVADALRRVTESAAKLEQLQDLMRWEGPRSVLIDGAQDLFDKRLKPFGGQIISAGACSAQAFQPSGTVGMGTEVMDAAQSISRALTHAGWTLAPPFPRFGDNCAMETIIVEVRPGASQRTRDAAVELQSVINEVLLQDVPVPKNVSFWEIDVPLFAHMFGELSADTIVILVGRHESRPPKALTVSKAKSK